MRKCVSETERDVDPQIRLENNNKNYLDIFIFRFVIIFLVLIFNSNKIRVINKIIQVCVCVN